MATKGGRLRALSDEEISLIKAMLDRGLKNDEVHFYFNRPGRLISSGRISQIRRGKYAALIPAAEDSVLDAFLQRFDERLPLNHERLIALKFAEVGGSWTLAAGETDEAECKQNFRLSPEYRFADCIKTIAGLANNKGGYIFFGVNDVTRVADGLGDDSFDQTDPADLNRCLAGALDPVPHVTMISTQVGGRKLGVLFVAKHDHPPIIATKNIGGDVKEGTIYYRYVGETRTIKPGELRQLIALREQKAVSDFVKSMSRVASGSAATLDLDSGRVDGRSSSFVIDRALLPSLQFLREGEFNEVLGAPALKLIGEVEPVSINDQERVRIIRENVTPDAIIRNFLTGERVLDPMQYIQAQAHIQRRWLPVWYYLSQGDFSVEMVVSQLKSQIASQPSSRESVVNRLLGKDSAFKAQSGRPAKLRAALVKESSPMKPQSRADIILFANALMGLPLGTPSPERFKPVLLSCLNREEGTESNGAARSAIYRAACRIDELLDGARYRPLDRQS
jgi:hypothetical protein